jgi:hypothetical protein
MSPPRTVYRPPDKAAQKAGERSQRIAVAARRIVVSAIEKALDAPYDAKATDWSKDYHAAVMAKVRDMCKRIENGLQP